MNVQLLKVGATAQPVVTMDRLTGRVDEIVAMAARMQPFPAGGNHYPGLRRLFTEEDGEASAYLAFCLRRVAPVLERFFGARAFRCLEASFSMVTTAADALTPQQRAPHFDSLDPGYVAVLHYLRPCDGTAFYRQRATGIEALAVENLAAYRDGIAREQRRGGYIAGTDASYERIGAVEGLADRVAIYRGALLHSGIIPEGMALSDDPLHGRLTANIFVHLQ